MGRRFPKRIFTWREDDGVSGCEATCWLGGRTFGGVKLQKFKLAGIFQRPVEIPKLTVNSSDGNNFHKCLGPKITGNTNGRCLPGSLGDCAGVVGQVNADGFAVLGCDSSPSAKKYPPEHNIKAN